MSYEKYKVWKEEYNGEDGADDVEADSAEWAAEKWVEDNHSELDYLTELEVFVKAPNGTKTRWVVTVELIPHFSATEVKTKECHSGTDEVRSDRLR